MKVLKFLVSAIVALALVGVVGFFFLGQSSQSGTAPGLADGRLSPCPEAPNCVSSEAGTAPEKQVDSFALDQWDAMPGAISAIGGTITTRDDGYIAAEFSSDIFGFVDDLEVRRGENGVEVRSASRVGYSDAGVNAARVAQLRAGLGG